MAAKAATPKVESEALIVAPTKIRVSRSIKRRGVPEHSESAEEIIEVHKFATTPTIIKCSLPLKMTMDYQSIGIEFGIERPCYAEEIDEASDEAYAIVFAKIQSKIPEIQQALMEIAGRAPTSK